jgi:type III secretion protein J
MSALATPSAPRWTTSSGTPRPSAGASLRGVARTLVRTLLAVVLALLAACGSEVVLQTGLNDSDANEIMTVLRHAGLSATKARQKDGVSLTVAEADLARATELMRAAGLPRRQLSLLGDVFKKDGMISTPLEERARYLHGLSQELEFTLSRIDRVVVARVHVVLPERVAPGEPVKPSSASVFVKYTPPMDEDLVLPRIRRLVMTSIPGLSEDDGRKLSVVLLPAEAIDDSVQWEYFGPFKMERSSAAAARTSLVVLGIVLALIAAGFFAWRALKKPQVQAQVNAFTARLMPKATPDPVATAAAAAAADEVRP